MSLSWYFTYWLELSGYLNGWTEVTDDVVGAVRASRGIFGTTLADRTARTGIMTFDLDNSEINSAKKLGYYSPGHANVRTGFKNNIGVQLRLHSDYRSIAFDGEFKKAVLAKAPTGYWHLEETSGTTATDSSGSGFHGTYNGGYTLNQAGLLGVTQKAVDFPSSGSSFVDVGNHAVLTPTGAFSFHCRVKPLRSFVNSVNYELFGNETFQSSGWLIRLESNHATTPTGGRVYVRFNRSGAFSDMGSGHQPEININVASTIGFSYDGTNGRIYVNGVRVQGPTAMTAAVAAATATYIGKGRVGPQYFNGIIDEVSTFGTVLSDAEFTALHALVSDTNVYTQFVKEVWTGRVLKATPDAGVHQNRRSHVYCTDYWDQLARKRLTGLPLQVDTLDHEIFELIVDAMPIQPRSRNVGTGFDILKYAFDNMEAEKAIPAVEIDRLCRSTLALSWVDGKGTLVYEPRSVRARNFLNSMELQPLDYPQGDSIDIQDDRSVQKNLFQAKLHPRTAGDTEVVLYEYHGPSTGGIAVKIEANAPFYLRGIFSEEGQQSWRAGGLDMQAPVPHTDYEFNAAPDGSGTDLTGDVSITAQYLANTVIYLIDSPVTAYLMFLRARGKQVIDHADILAQASDQDHIDENGENSEQLDMPYPTTDSVKFGNEVVQYALFISLQTAKRVRTVRLNLEGMEISRAALAAGREISERIGISEPMNALNGLGFNINAITYEKSGPDGPINISWVPTVSDATAYWLLEIPGRSELGITTRLGFSLILGHTDTAHGDSHTDTAHSDVAFTDTHGDAAHGDAAHSDSAHSDVAHGDVAHGDIAHGDVAAGGGHNDVWFDDSHGDSAHGDSHGDTAGTHRDEYGHADHEDGFHLDGPAHDDGIYGHTDTHSDAAHADGHVDIPHGDSHTDNVHSDIAHTDTAHTDSHTDAGHGDSAHLDDAHSDSHGDVTHSDVVHTDSHSDVAHGDQN